MDSRFSGNLKHNKSPFILVLGVAQDGGFPQAGCNKKCCRDAWKNPKLKKHVSCLAIIDPLSNQSWLIDATPDFKEQIHMLNKIAPGNILNGILLTHGHIGHYTGLINLGKEVMNTRNMPVYCASKMAKFLSGNLPWNQLIKNKNVKINKIESSCSFKLNNRIKITPFAVPHRDEFTETLGYRINSMNKSVVYIPDIDSWKKWNKKIGEVIKGSSRAYIDGTFYNKKEIPHRSLSKIPHPFITDTVTLLNALPNSEKDKVHFIHLNHTNPLLKPKSSERKKIEKAGFHAVVEMNKFYL